MFALADLPERIDPGTRARLAEIFDQAPDQLAVVIAATGRRRASW